MKLLPITLLILVTATACEEKHRERWLVDPVMTNCSGVGAMLCYTYTSAKNSSPRPFYDGIDGFHYEWGYTWDIVIEWRPVHNVVADGSSRRYKLKTLVEKTPVEPGYTFTLEVPYYFADYDSTSGSGSLRRGDLAFTTPDAEIRSILNDNLRRWQSLGKLTFQFQASPRDSVRIIGAEPPLPYP